MRGSRLTPEARRESLVRLSMASYMFLQEEMGVLRPRPESQLRDEIPASSIWLPAGRPAAAVPSTSGLSRTS